MVFKLFLSITFIRTTQKVDELNIPNNYQSIR